MQGRCSYLLCILSLIFISPKIYSFQPQRLLRQCFLFFWSYCFFCWSYCHAPFICLYHPLEMLPSFAFNTTCKSPRGPPPPDSSCCTVILKCPLFLGPSVYELNSIKNACKCLLPSKSKPIPIVFICLKEGTLLPARVQSRGL